MPSLIALQNRAGGRPHIYRNDPKGREQLGEAGRRKRLAAFPFTPRSFIHRDQPHDHGFCRGARSQRGDSAIGILREKQPAPLVVELPPEVAPRIPSGWIEGVARLSHRCPPTDIPPHRWRQFLNDCTKFLASPGEWAERAAALGWDAVALFGCCRHRPLDRPGSAGLLWVINGGRLVELHRDWAVVELAENGSRRIFERRRLDAENVRLPWIGA
jgi:hypothetical protein